MVLLAQGCSSDSNASQGGNAGTATTANSGAAGQQAGAGANAGGSSNGSSGANGTAGTSNGGGGVTAGGTAGSLGAGESNAGAAGSAGTAGNGGDGGSGGVATGPNVDLTDPQLHEFELDPVEVDPTVADSLETQFAQLDTRATPLGILVLFLPGANNVPNDWSDHGRQLASYGFHVLIPHYNNRWSTNGVCDGMGNTCNNDTRWEALVGEDTSAAISIARADSVEGRVVTMIHHLEMAHPGGDWGYYLGADDALRYDQMIIAGISHGAASAGMYAIGRPFTRCVMHSSGPQGDNQATKMTPLSEWYAFTHTADPAYDAIASALDNFRVPGEPASIDGATAPFGESHQLTSAAESEYPHGSTCAHSSSPRDENDNYLFDAAWRYLYGAPVL
jgi:hypothetical protein